jgi:hypothetical protein
MTDITTEMVTAAWDADLAWLRSPDRERGGTWARVPEPQLRRLLEAAAPLIAAAERARCIAEIFTYADEKLTPPLAAAYRDAARLLERTP